MLLLVLRVGPTCECEQGLNLLVPGRGRPSRRGLVVGTAVLAGDVGGGSRAARRSIMETATRNAAGGTAAMMRPQASGTPVPVPAGMWPLGAVRALIAECIQMLGIFRLSRQLSAINRVLRRLTDASSACPPPRPAAAR